MKLNLAELRRLEENATAGPWYHHECAVSAGKLKHGVGVEKVADCCLDEHGRSKPMWRPEDDDFKNSVFISASRNAFRQLLDIAEAAKQLDVKRLNQLLEDVEIN